MTRTAWFATLSLSLIAASTAYSSFPTAEKTKVIIVADVGVDDAAGLLWALDDYDDYSLDVMGVAASFGSHPDPAVTAHNARLVLDAAGHSDVPVYVGSRWPRGTSEPHAVDEITTSLGTFAATQAFAAPSPRGHAVAVHLPHEAGRTRVAGDVEAPAPLRRREALDVSVHGAEDGVARLAALT